MKTTVTGSLLLASMTVFIATPVAAEITPPLVLAQRLAQPGSGPSLAQRQQDQYLQIAQRLRSQCLTAASTLWTNNGYERWRAGKSSMMHMLYTSGAYPTLPPAPPAFAEPLRGKLEASVTQANDLAKESGATFKELADYINAKDYEDDKFKKGDALNAKLVAAGRACHDLFGELTALYTQAAESMIAERKASAAKPEIVETMIADWRKTRELSGELGRFEKADPAKLDGLVKDVSTLADDRKGGLLKDDQDVRVRNFYAALNDKVAVKMRRFLRDAKTPAAFAAMAKDAPRSSFWEVKGDIDVGMPDEILRAIQSMK
jgi:hypothetical protein